MHEPLVSIGLPVLHDAALMARSIESVLEQTEPRWELLLMEDGDTERGADLMRPWLEKDTRIRYIRQSSDVGMTRLNNRLLQVASGDFFAWFTPGDCYRKDFLAESLAVLQPSGSSSQEPPVVACYPQAAFIHPVTGEETLHQNSFLLLAASPEERLRVFFSTKHAGFTASGLMRSDALRAVGGLPEDCADPVLALVTRLLLCGRFVQLKMPLLLTNRKPTTKADPTLRHAGLERDLFGDRLTETLRLPTVRLVRHILRAVVYAPTIEPDRKETLLAQLKALLLKKYAPVLRLETDRAVRLCQSARWSVRWGEDERRGEADILPSHRVHALSADMERDLQAAQTLFPDHPGLWLSRAVCAYFGGRPEEARWLCTQEALRHPNNGDVMKWQERLHLSIFDDPLAWVD